MRIVVRMLLAEDAKKPGLEIAIRATVIFSAELFQVLSAMLRESSAEVAELRRNDSRNACRAAMFEEIALEQIRIRRGAYR